MPKGSLASKVIKSPRKIFLTKRKLAKVNKQLITGNTESYNPVPADGYDNIISEYPHEVSKDWYREIIQCNDNQDKVTVEHPIAQTKSDNVTGATDCKANEAFNRASLNKPLPALPDPYFEYLFADAGVEKATTKRDSDGFSIPKLAASAYPGASRRNSIIDSIGCDQESDMVVEGVSSPESNGPITPAYNDTPSVAIDMSAFSLYAFHQANVPSMSSVATVAQGSLKRAQVAAGILHNTTIQDDSLFLASATSKLSPLVATNIPTDNGQPVWASPRLASGIEQAKFDSLDRAILDVGEYARQNSKPGPQNVIMAVDVVESTKEKTQVKRSIKSLAAKWITRRQGKGEATSINTSTVYSGISSLKRPASDSFDTRSLFSDSDESIVYLGTKKLRTKSPVPEPKQEADDPTALSTTAPVRPIHIPTSSTIEVVNETPDIPPWKRIYDSYLTESPSSIDPTIAADPVIIDLASSDAPAYTPLDTKLPSPLTANWLAYPGQFVGPALNLITAKTKMGAMKKPQVMVFGDRSHANGPVIHKNCYPAPTSPKWNYDDFTLSRRSELFRCFEDMDCSLELAASAPVAMLRVASQENLRKEAHVELASARLEGVFVGEYRYYQGHLSVEEYVSKGLCVCWSLCACSRVCSRYGDVLCPCSADLALASDSDSESEEGIE